MEPTLVAEPYTMTEAHVWPLHSELATNDVSRKDLTIQVQ